MPGKQPGVTHAQINASRAAAARVEVARRVAHWEAIAVLDWMLGFERRALAVYKALGIDPKSATAKLAAKTAKYWILTKGPVETAAVDQIKGLQVDLQETVLQLAAEIDSLQQKSKAAYASLIRSLDDPQNRQNRKTR